jgi:2'-5' RNA ligase
VFLGLTLPEALKDRLLTWTADIAGARWQRRDQLHLTLCFLGDVEPERVPALFRALDGLDAPAFTLEPAGVGCFGDPDKPRNLWVGVRPEEPVRTLHEVLCQRLSLAGFPVVAGHFYPHITLARFGRRQAGPASAFLDQYRDLPAPAFLVDGVRLFLSQPGPEGSRYQQLAVFPLKDARG